LRRAVDRGTMRVHPSSQSGRPMDPILSIGQDLFLRHRHDDGSWAAMERVEHDSAAHDAERSWPRRAIFRCTVCDEEVSVDGDDADADGNPKRR
jgi:hypothetical protein